MPYITRGDGDMDVQVDLYKSNIDTGIRGPQRTDFAMTTNNAPSLEKTIMS